MAEQTYTTHRRYLPVFHFFVEPVLILNVVAQLLYFNKDRTLYRAWTAVVAIALAVLVFVARYMVARVQDRVIRLEERTRLESIAPAELRGRINDITMRQLVALRFASDEELPGLAARCLSGELESGEQIKKAIKTWRPDNARA
jgi:hypothetical protein